MKLSFFKPTFKRLLSLMFCFAYAFMSLSLFAGCSLLKPSFNRLSMKRVIRTLEKDFDAKEYDEEPKLGYGFVSFEDDDQAYYITSNGKYDDYVDIKTFAGFHRGLSMGPADFKYIMNIVDSTDNEYVMYRRGDGYNKSVCMLYIEFEDSSDAMDAFDTAVNIYFVDGMVNRYRDDLQHRQNIIENESDTLFAEYALKNANNEKVIGVDDLDDDDYEKSSKSGRFEYNFHWDITTWGDMANPYPYDADKIAEYSKQREGVVGYYLYVEDNRLILISGVDYNKESKRIDEVDALCESFGIASPFDTKTDNDLKKYMLYYWQEWHPNYSRIDSI